MDQIALLESRGLIVDNKARAEHYLKHISYYRLSAYALPFQVTKDIFNKGVAFDDILNLYLFDRELRLIVLDAIERIEVAIRTQIIYQLSHKYGSHWQDNSGIFLPPSVRGQNTIDVFGDIQKAIADHCKSKNPEVFIQHYLQKYTQPPTPPSWMCVELFTLGQLSRLFTALNHNSDKAGIANYFGLHHRLFHSWIHALNYGRNLCAHHSRLWNRDFAIQPEIPYKSLPLPWIDLSFNNNRRCFYFLCVVKYFLQTINPGGHFKDKVEALVNAYPNVPIQLLGIPTDNNGKLVNWKVEPLWQV